MKIKMVKTPALRAVLAAVISCIIIGVAAFAVKKVIALISHVATSGFDTGHSNWWLLLLGIASIMLSGFIVRKVVRMPIEHATDRVRRDLEAGRSPLPRRMMIAPLAVNAVTLGLGGSAGAEGPIAYAGGAIASRMAKLFGLSENQILTFLACGAGAGIAAIFKAPLGGVFFTLEVLRYPLNLRSTLMLVAMCLISGLGAYAFSGFTSDMPFVCSEPFELKWYVPAILLGVICGLYSLYYIWSGESTARKLEAVGRPWVRNLVAGAILGVCLFLFPSLYGEGYGILAKVAAGDFSVVTEGTYAHGLAGSPLIAIVLIGILLLKSFACYATNSGGGVAGEFAPTIFAGGMVGALFVICAGMIPGWESIPAGCFVVLAMAAVMGGAIKAPLMAIFIVAEMTMTPTLLLPICITTATSYFIANLRKFSKIFI